MAKLLVDLNAPPKDGGEKLPDLNCVPAEDQDVNDPLQDVVSQTGEQAFHQG
jgi:hypothetical protein